MSDKRGRFEAEVLPHLDAAYRFARWLARSESDADDIVQESVLRAFRGFDALRSPDAKAWLLKIVRNCHATSRRQQQRHALTPLPDDPDAQSDPAMIATTPDPETATIQRDQGRTLERLLAMLPQEHREVLLLREVEDLDYREIAAVIDVPIGTVMSRLARARAALKSRWLTETAGDSHGVR